MPTFSVRIKDQGRYDKAVLRFKAIQDKLQGNPTQVETLETVFDIAEGINVQSKFQGTPASAQDVIDEINCPYLQFDGNWFCLELVHRTKKKKDLGWNAEETLALCRSCQQGKNDQVKQEMEKSLRKKGIKDIMQLRDLFIEMMDKGGPVKLWICKADLLQKHELQLCMDMKNLNCPLNEYQEVSIQHFCSTQINPETNDIPCPHLKLRIITGKIESQETRDLINQIYLEHQASNQQPPKVVEAEQEEKEKEEE